MAAHIVTIKTLDHLVLTCKSIPKTIHWYTTNLGMTHQTFHPTSSPSSPRHALLFGTPPHVQKINLHQAGKEFEPKAQVALPGTADLCFIVNSDDVSGRGDEEGSRGGKGGVLEQAIKGFEKSGTEVLEGGGVVERTGARGRIRSVYVRDPDGNLIELSEYIE